MSPSVIVWICAAISIIVACILFLECKAQRKNKEEFLKYGKLC